MKKKNKNNKLLKPALYLSMMAIVLGYAYSIYVTSAEQDERGNITQILRSEPGIIVINAADQNGKFLISGLVDPLAKQPSLLINHGTLKHIEVELNFKPFLSMESKIVLLRLKQNFNIPDSVTMSLNSNELSLTGRSTQFWLDTFKTDFDKFSGVGSLNISKMTTVK